MRVARVVFFLRVAVWCAFVVFFFQVSHDSPGLFLVCRNVPDADWRVAEGGGRGEWGGGEGVLPFFCLFWCRLLSVKGLLFSFFFLSLREGGRRGPFCRSFFFSNAASA